MTELQKKIEERAREIRDEVILDPMWDWDNLNPIHHKIWLRLAKHCLIKELEARLDEITGVGDYSSMSTIDRVKDLEKQIKELRSL